MALSGKIKLGLLTSSRADFGVYLPLLKLIRERSDEFELELIVFGTHLSRFHGYTKNEILREGFDIHHEIAALLLTDDAGSIASGYALTALKFADFWKTQGAGYDWVICLGDRFEMAAAVAAGIPFGIQFAHVHGGDTTLGAIDNIYRHSITLASQLHFVSAQPFAQKIYELAGTDAKCYLTGSLSLDNLDEISLLPKDEFCAKWGIPASRPFVLVTVHPETVAYEKNHFFAKEVYEALSMLTATHNLVITMPNADTAGTIFRDSFQQLKHHFAAQTYLIENFGTQSYFSCMQYADFMIGNTSSGIVEAASFKKFVLNLGDRQKGRLAGENVLHVPFDRQEIIKAATAIEGKEYQGANLYKIGRAAPIMLTAITLNS